MVGGRTGLAHDERLLRFVFPERPGALMKFLSLLRPNWNISLFHYRNQGADYGRILVGLQVPAADDAAFDDFLEDAGLSLRGRNRQPGLPAVPAGLRPGEAPQRGGAGATTGGCAPWTAGGGITASGRTGNCSVKAGAEPTLAPSVAARVFDRLQHVAVRRPWRRRGTAVAACHRRRSARRPADRCRPPRPAARSGWPLRALPRPRPGWAPRPATAPPRRDPRSTGGAPATAGGATASDGAASRSPQNTMLAAASAQRPVVAVAAGQRAGA